VRREVLRTVAVPRLVRLPLMKKLMLSPGLAFVYEKRKEVRKEGRKEGSKEGSEGRKEERKKAEKE
jgi:hypothetical protein